MKQADLLYSGLMVTAVILSIWTGVFLAAACVFFAPVLFPHRREKVSTRKP